MQKIQAMISRKTLDFPSQPDQEQEEEEFRSRRATTIFEEDPEKWIRNNIIGKNMILKAQFLGRLGMGAKAIHSMSKENMQRMSKVHDREKKKQQEEETSIGSTSDSDLEMDNCYSNMEGDFAISFFKKSDDEMRSRYINKLINMKIMKLEPAKKHQTMIIFDWDDTLLCTHFLAGQGFVDIPPEELKNLIPLDEAASRLLLKAISYGQTFIITNSAEGWVQCSGKLFMPKTFQVIMEKNIRVISARSGYEDMFPGDSHRWKVEAFLDIEHLFDKNIITNLICVGDSHIEMDAAHILAQKFSQAIIKTIKFKENPKPEELAKQQDLVREKMDQIYMSIKNLTIRLEKKAQKPDDDD